MPVMMLSRLVYYIRHPQHLLTAAAFVTWAVIQRVLGQPRNCPYCASTNTKSLGHRFFFLSLLRCEECGLMFRYPKQTDAWCKYFYMRTDTSGDELPRVEDVRRLMNQKFVGTKYSVSRLIDLFSTINRGRLLDYGCSWGYGVWQYRDNGYDAVGFDLSKPKAMFGMSELGVPIIDDFTELESLSASSFDYVVACHVLEHLPQIDNMLRLFSRLLRAGGKLVVLVPNADCTLAQEGNRLWPYMISREHNLALDAAWFQRNIGRYGLTPLFSSAKFGERLTFALTPYDKDTSRFCHLLEEELLMIATKE